MNEEEFLPDKEDMAVNELGTMLHDVLECFCREHAVLKDGIDVYKRQISNPCSTEITALWRERPKEPSTALRRQNSIPALMPPQAASWLQERQPPPPLRSWPVSYTHLDVYKRQSFIHPWYGWKALLHAARFMPQSIMSRPKGSSPAAFSLSLIHISRTRTITPGPFRAMAMTGELVMKSSSFGKSGSPLMTRSRIWA